MKIKLNIILVLAVCFSQSVRSQITFPKGTDERTIVATLFEGNWREKDTTCVWMPNLSESVQFISEHQRDTLFTKLDTVFNYKENYIEKKLILVSTNSFNNICHACQPVLGLIELRFDNEKNEYQLNYVQKFVSKYGTWGEAPKKRGLLQLGEGIYCVKITEYSNAFGTKYGLTSLFRDGKKIFSFDSFRTNINAVEFKYQEYKYSSTILFDKKSNTIKITKSGKETNGLGKIVKVNSISTYEYDGEFLTKKSTKNVLTTK